jgi:hypothetical protein
MHRWIIALALSTACSAPSADDDAGAPLGAFASNDCAPDDGRALRLQIGAGIDGCGTAPTGRTIELYVFSGVDSVFPIAPGDTITSQSGTTFGNGNARDCTGATCRMSQDWTLTFDVFEDDVSAAGSYMIDFDGDIVSGRFEATFCDTTPPLCG